jgi:hypothetical protein
MLGGPGIVDGRADATKKGRFIYTSIASAFLYAVSSGYGRGAVFNENPTH